MASMPRTIHLRRPPVISLQEGVFVPRVDEDLAGEVEHRWRAIQEANPAAFDGRLCHVLGVHRNGYGGATIHVSDCAYRFYAVQDDEFDLGVRPLGVKGVVIVDDEVLMGRRSSRLARYPGLLEFVPGGVVEPGDDGGATVLRELEEEAGLTASGTPAAVAVLYDEVARTWEIVYRVGSTSKDVNPSAEHDSLQWRTIDSLNTINDLSPAARIIAEQFVPPTVPTHSGGRQPQE